MTYAAIAKAKNPAAENDLTVIEFNMLGLL